MKKSKLAAFAVVAILFTGLGVVFGDKITPASQTSGSAPDQAPSPTANLYAQTLDDLSGKPHALAQWKGKPLLVNFWATWCGPCVQEMPELSALANEDGGKRFNVIGVGIDSPSAGRIYRALSAIRMAACHSQFSSVRMARCARLTSASSSSTN
jgi:thiol-disulfide isomerase/thioredoxin